MSTQNLKYKIIENNKYIGNHVVADKPLKKGELLIEETSFASIPFKQNIVNGSMCALCCAHTKPEQKVQCSYGCELWFCGETCSNDMIHQLECSFISKVAQATIDCKLSDLSHAILVLRILLKKNVLSENYKDGVGKLSVQRSDFKKRAPQWLESYEKFADHFIELLKQDKYFDTTLLAFFTRDEIIDIACATMVNSFASTKNSIIVSNGFFYQAALLNHSCQPNTFYSINKNKLKMRCIKDIEKDGDIFDSYVDLLEPTFERQQILLQTKHFYCKCERCQDPTECGRHISSFKCPSCQDGWVSPIISYNEKDNVLARLWRCLSCRQEQNERIIQILKDIDQFKQFLAEKKWRDDTTQFLQDQEKYAESTLKLLHDNHVLRLQYHLNMGNCYDKAEKYRDAIVHCKQVKKIVKQLLRVQSGELVECYELIADLYEKLFLSQIGTRLEETKEVFNADSESVVSSTKAIKENLIQSNRYLQKAYECAVICYGEDDENTITIRDQIKKLTTPQSTSL